MVFINGIIITPERILENLALVVNGTRIKDIVPESNQLRLKPVKTVSLNDRYLNSGFVDIHFHVLRSAPETRNS